MLAASLLDEDWLSEVERLAWPYFFVSDGVLTYLREEDVTGALAQDRGQVPRQQAGVRTYPLATFKWEHKMAAKRGLARWQWPCDDPRTLERLGLRLLESARVTRPPAGFRAELPARYRYAPARRSDSRPWRSRSSLLRARSRALVITSIPALRMECCPGPANGWRQVHLFGVMSSRCVDVSLVEAP